MISKYIASIRDKLRPEAWLGASRSFFFRSCSAFGSKFDAGRAFRSKGVS
jgi:hypothetical protein